MSNSQVRTSEDVYSFVERVKDAADRHNEAALAEQLENALRLGSSALEILGAIREVLIEKEVSIERLLGHASRQEINQVIIFVDKAYGRR